MSLDPSPSSNEKLEPAWRWTIYALLVGIALTSCTARLMNVRSRDQKSPFLSANDRSRWCTIRSLVESNTYVIDRLHTKAGWQTIDKVWHQGPDGEKHYYSSKPPLLATLLAAQYWLIRQTTGATLEHHTFGIARTMLFFTNIVPLAVYFWILVRLIDRFAVTNWGKTYAVSAACFGTYLTTFSVTLNNHLPAAICTLLALYVFIAIWYDQARHPSYFAVAGLSGAFAAANELPALSLLGLLGLALLVKDWRRTCAFGLPCVALVGIGFAGTNYLAHQSFIPPYAHRDSVEPEKNWYVYPNSHWLAENRKGIDAGEPSPLTYAVHLLVGHHGVFSLTPIWILSVWGMALWLRPEGRKPMATLACGIAILSLICIGFYLCRPLIDRNYGGVTSGLRWMFWFTPLWIFAMLPVLDQIHSNRTLRQLAYGLLFVSVFSTTYPAMNPWQHPWPYRLGEYCGWW